MAKKTQEPNLEAFSPSQFMRARRPERFSDSVTLEEPQLSKTLLEYHLDTLTSRGQENEFEHFCRRLAEKEICPNLLPQTGPTGGGDSKVDSETYPVADEISLLWYEGIDRKAAYERWAFAFSAKEKWRPKAISDVKKIVGTKRDYKVIYFMSSRFISDKKRADLEDKLRKDYEVDVRILDRNWIVTKVFDNKREELAVETLNIDVSGKRVVKVGPLDVERQEQLEELEALITDRDRYKYVGYQLVEDCLTSIKFARELELPRTEIEGKIARAERVTEKYGSQQQRLRCAYSKAWTAIWWFDDFGQLNNVYGEVEKHAVGSWTSTDLEKVANLWYILMSSVKRGQLSAEASDLLARTTTLKSELNRLANNRRRRNNALHAKTILLLVELTEAVTSDQKVSDLLLQLRQVFRESKGLVNYPISSFIDVLLEMGNSLSKDPNYDLLFEEMLSITQDRESGAAAGRLLLDRGVQKLDSGKPYDAIAIFGRAQSKLAQNQSIFELILVLYALARAYERVGLLWAARSHALAAANIAFTSFWAEGDLAPETLLVTQRLVWLELQLGRIPLVLNWIELANFVAETLELHEERREKFINERANQDMVLGILFLKADLDHLKWLRRIPPTLESLGLAHSWAALVYALGNEQVLFEEGFIPADAEKYNMLDFCTWWLTQPASTDLPSKPLLLNQKKLYLTSSVLGCKVAVEVENNKCSTFLAESILSALEALLATSLNQDVVPQVAALKIIITPSAFSSNKPTFSIEEKLEPVVTIKHPEAYDGSSDDELYREWLTELLVQLIGLIAYIPNFEKTLSRIVKDEDGFGRALSFTNAYVSVENLLGRQPKLTISAWEAKEGIGSKQYPLQRTTEWYSDVVRVESVEEKTDEPLKFGEGNPPEISIDFESHKHSDQQVYSLINNKLWDQAGWTGAGYIYDPHYLPSLALMFRNQEVGRNIFQEWRERLGFEDTNEELRITIVQGISVNNPFWYRLIVGSNIKVNDRAQERRIISSSRIHLMEATTSDNLNGFLQLFKLRGKYALMPALFPDSSRIEDATFDTDLAINKTQVNIRQAWEIQENDPDGMGLQEDDEITIPDGISDPPGLKALARIKSMRNRR